MNYKRKKPRRQVRCTMCTDARWGNSKKADPPRGRARRQQAAIKEQLRG